MRLTLQQLDPYTLTWFRFLVAAVLTGAWLAARGRLGGYRSLGRRGWALLGFAALMLVGNYVLYLLGVQYTSPANAQLLIQLAPLLMTLGGIWVFGERFRAAQWLGLAALALGMLLFFRDQLLAAAAAPGYVSGSLLVVVGAVVWAVYALLQKQLLMQLGSMSNMFGALKSGAVEASMVSPPTQFLSEKIGFKELLSVTDMNYAYPNPAMATSGEMIRKKPDLIDRFIRAYVRGVHRGEQTGNSPSSRSRNTPA